MDKAQLATDLADSGFTAKAESGEKFGFDFYEFAPKDWPVKVVCYTNGEHMIVQEEGGNHAVSFSIEGLTKDEIMAKIKEQAETVLAYKGDLSDIVKPAEEKVEE